MLAGYRTGGVHPQSSGLRNILACYGTRAPHSGEPYTEAMVFGIGGGLGLSYRAWESAGRPPMVAVSFRNTLERDAGFFPRACARLNATVTEHETASAPEATRTLNEMLANGEAGLLWLDLAALPYQLQPRDLIAWPEYEVVVCGYDPRSDCYELDNRAPRPWHVRSDILADARAAIPSDRHRLAVVSTPEEYPDLPGVIAAGIRDCVEAMARPVTGNLGLPAIETWARLVNHQTDREGWASVFPRGAALYDALTSTYASVACNGTGGDGLRTLYAEFLDEAGGATNTPAYREAAEMFRVSARLWQHFAGTLLPDDAGNLRKARALLNTNRRLFEQDGETVLPGMVANAGELAGLREAAVDSFPLPQGRVDDLLGELREQLLAIHEVESAAIACLDAATRQA